MNTADEFNKLADIVKQAKALGADGVVARYATVSSLSASVRMGKLEEAEESQDSSISIQVLIGKQTGNSMTSSLRSEALAAAIESAVAGARAAPENPYAGLADPSQIARSYPALDSADPFTPALAALTEAALNAEDTALSQKGIVQAEGNASHSRSKIFTLASNGFAGERSGTSNGLYVVGYAASNGAQERAYDHDAAVYYSDLRNTTDIGLLAAQRTLQKLNSSKPATGRIPVVFESDTASDLVSAFVNAIAGDSVAKKTTFLQDALGQKIFPDNIRITEDPLLARGLGSRAFDGEGILAQPRTLVESGVLKTWLLDLESARKLGLQTTGNGNGSGGISVSNIALEAGTLDLEALLSSIKEGFYVTDLMGHGPNMVNGELSYGASGLRIRDGKITAEAISGATIAGNLKDMFLNLTPANDLNRRRSKISAPTLRIDGMTVGGG